MISVILMINIKKSTQLAHLIAMQAEAAIGKTNDTNFDAKSHCCVAD